MERREALKLFGFISANLILPYKNAFSNNDRINEYIEKMPLSERIKQILIYNPKNSGEIIPNSNVILMGWSFPSGLYEKAREITNFHEIGNFIAVDQEGGGVRRLKGARKFRGVKFPSVANLGKMPEEEILEEGKKYGELLRDTGINMLLTSIDVADPKTKMYNDRRSFGSEAETVVKKASAYFKGVRISYPQITILGQHFPVYNVSANSDYSKAVDNFTKQKIEEKSKSFFDTNVDGFMISSITYPAFSNNIASLDEEITKWARTKGDDKILMSDDFRGILRQGNSLESATIKMFNTEIDIMLMVPKDYTVRANLILQEYIKNTEGAEERLNKKVKRILLRKKKMRLFNL